MGTAAVCFQVTQNTQDDRELRSVSIFQLGLKDGRPFT